MAAFATLDLRTPDRPLFLQGFQVPGSDALTEAVAGAGGLAVLRVPAFPDAEALRARLRALRTRGCVGLDLKGVLGEAERLLEMAKEEGVSFLVHGARVKEDMARKLRSCAIPRLALATDTEEAQAAEGDGAQGLVLRTEALGARLEAFRRRLDLPLLASVGTSFQGFRDGLAEGLAGFQFRSPTFFRQAPESEAFGSRLRAAFATLAERFDRAPEPLPGLRIRNLELTYPILQGGMGVGVSWEGLAGAVARAGCGGVVSAIGTGYRYGTVDLIQGRPKDPTNLNHAPSLARILGAARERAQGRGAVGVNILCAINDYGRVVREAVEAGAQMVISGAGLPLALPEQVGDADVALIPIVSSARALDVICRQWQRKYQRLPDAVVLEGPLSGGHQGVSLEQCADPAHSLEAVLPQVLEARDKWGEFPVIVAGGVWDHADIRAWLARGAGGVQMGTRFIGTLECDASDTFKSVILKAKASDIGFMKSPVGLPARGVFTPLQQAIAEGTAPKVRCISNCLIPCGKGEGAREAGYCIADRLADAWEGRLETGLFFSGANGHRLEELVTVRELVEELTEDWDLSRLS